MEIDVLVGVEFIVASAGCLRPGVGVVDGELYVWPPLFVAGSEVPGGEVSLVAVVGGVGYWDAGPVCSADSGAVL